MRKTLAKVADDCLLRVVAGLEAGRGPTETDWILDVPEREEEHLFSYWALTVTS